MNVDVSMPPEEENLVAPAAEPLDGAHEPCPTPLQWQEVLVAYEESATGQLICTDNCEIPVHEFGNGPPLLIFPSLTGPSRLFVLTAWLLKDEFQCVLIDHPRWQRAPTPKRLVDETAKAYAKIVEAYSKTAADLIAPSWGGQVALHLMASHPGLIRRACLPGAWASRKLTVAERAVLRVASLTPGTMQKVPLWLRTQLRNHRQWFPPFDESRFAFLLHETGETPTGELARRMRATTFDVGPELARISSELMLLRTEGEGPPISRAMEQLEAAFPQAQREWMPITGHFPYLTHPHRFVKFVRQFFTPHDS